MPTKRFYLSTCVNHAEFEHGHIAGAHLLPRGIIEASADTGYPKHYPPLSGARDQQVVLYCATSGRSAMAAAVLQMMGFKNVLNLAGGYARWEDEGMVDVFTGSFSLLWSSFLVLVFLLIF